MIKCVSPHSSHICGFIRSFFVEFVASSIILVVNKMKCMWKTILDYGQGESFFQVKISSIELFIECF